MALVSPGIQISINDQSQYVQTNVGSVPLVLLATAQDKMYNGALASGTSQAMAGKLQSFTSQRDLVTAMGTPKFQLSSSGTPINGSELNEYGLMTAYSALGLANQVYAIRADIDLGMLTGTSVRPVGNEANGTQWLDLMNTNFGIYEWDPVAGNYTQIQPLLITDKNQVANDNSYSYPVPTPLTSVGNPGQYALVFVNTDGSPVSDIILFYKADATAYGSLPNTWVQVGNSVNWCKSVYALQGTVASPTGLAPGQTFKINAHTITTTGSTVAQLASDINTALAGYGELGVVAKADASVGNKLTLYVTPVAKSNGTYADGKLKIEDNSGSPLTKCGVTAVGGASLYQAASVFLGPQLYYGTYAQEPSWTVNDNTPQMYNTQVGYRPAGTVWWKTTSVGGGFNPVLKKYNASLDSWATETTPFYSNYTAATYGLDPIGGGVNVAHGQTIATWAPPDLTLGNGLRFFAQSSATITTATGSAAVNISATGSTFVLNASAPGSASFIPYTIGPFASGTSAQAVVSAILAAQIPYVTASYNATTYTITLTHTSGGQIILRNTAGTPLTDIGFGPSSTGTGYTTTSAGNVIMSNWLPITGIVNFSTSQPYGNPTDGTLWYYSNPADVDIMINDNGWNGYRMVTSDARGYALSQTDSNGVIVSAGTAPTSQHDGSPLVKGDLWLDSSDLINYPSLYRYNGTAWIAIDNTDHTSSNGIIFADARWDTTGSTNVVSDALPAISTLLMSNYIDLDAPDWRLYPRGTLLFNTRRSGFNVKKFVSNYFNATSFPPYAYGNTQGYPSATPSQVSAWVSESGLNENGTLKAGAAAQRGVVVAALRSAIDSNLDILEDNYRFNLIVCPGYPELISNMVTLNDNRGDTAFVIGDTPMTLTPDSISLTQWSNNTNGNGLSTASAYLGVYYPAGLTNDLAGNTVVVPASHAVLRTYMYNDNVSHPWFAPAGTHRGLVDNLTDIGYINQTTGAFVHTGISQGVRDVLYTLNINPITQLPGVGLVVWGQETRSGTSSARNRVNVVRLENYLRVIFKSIANGYLFEPNDTITRKSIAKQIEGALNNVLSLRGLTDFLVVCDASNNTSSTIANNQLYVDVAVEPMRDVEFIYIPIALYNPGTIAGLGLSST